MSPPFVALGSPLSHEMRPTPSRLYSLRSRTGRWAFLPFSEPSLECRYLAGLHYLPGGGTLIHLHQAAAGPSGYGIISRFAASGAPLEAVPYAAEAAYATAALIQ